MKKEQSDIEDPHQIIMDVRRQCEEQQKKKKKKKKKRGRLVETDIDLFAEEDKK